MEELREQNEIEIESELRVGPFYYTDGYGNYFKLKQECPSLSEITEEQYQTAMLALETTPGKKHWKD